MFNNQKDKLVKKIILLNGEIGVGKSYLANIFVANGFVKESYAYTLKKVAHNVMKDFFDNFYPEMIYGDYNAKNTPLTTYLSTQFLNSVFYFEDWLEHQKIVILDDKTKVKCKRMFFKKLNQKNITPREIMQYLGTEIFRNIIHKDFNVFSLLQRLSNINNDVIIDDYRFLNEHQILKEKKHKVYAVKLNKNVINDNKHESENQELYFDFIINLGDNEYVTEKHYQEIIGRINASD